MALPDYTTQDPATYKANIDSSVSDLDTKVGGLNTKVINIGDWNMVTTSLVNITHGLTLSKIVTVTGYITNDAETSGFPITQSNTGGSISPPVAVEGWSSTTVILVRATSGPFDHVDFSAVSPTIATRGKIVITHTD